jgi:hypothetical protein
MGVRLDGQRPTLGVLLRGLAEGSATLIRQEVQLVRLEVSELIGALTSGVVSVVIGAVMLLLGGLTLLIGLILLGGDQWLRDRYWLAALIVFAISGGFALLFRMLGASLLSPRQLVPKETVETLKEDTEWVKQQLTSGATSS